MITQEIHGAINKALYLLPPQMMTPEARIMLFAIGLQESRFENRFQIVSKLPKSKGPARGYWQFERGGGCRGVITHPAASYWMHHICSIRKVEFNPQALWEAIEKDDVLAAAAARLLLFTDSKKLPKIGDEEGAWDLYIRTWRPGKPHRNTWHDLYENAKLHVIT